MMMMMMMMTTMMMLMMVMIHNDIKECYDEKMVCKERQERYGEDTQDGGYEYDDGGDDGDDDDGGDDKEDYNDDHGYTIVRQDG